MVRLGRHGACVVAVSLALGAVATGAARAQTDSGDRVLVYVNDVVTADPKMAAQAASLTSSLCGQLAKEKRLDVMCAPDVKQIMGFAATSFMIGTTNAAVEKVEARLSTVKHVVQATLTPRANDYVLTVQLGPRAEEADASSMFSNAPVLRIEEVSPAEKPKLLEKLPEVAQRLARSMLAPPAPSTSAPPAPLTPAPSTSTPPKK
jgi:hypothetical protein